MKRETRLLSAFFFRFFPLSTRKIIFNSSAQRQTTKKKSTRNKKMNWINCECVWCFFHECLSIFFCGWLLKCLFRLVMYVGEQRQSAHQKNIFSFFFLLMPFGSFSIWLLTQQLRSRASWRFLEWKSLFCIYFEQSEEDSSPWGRRYYANTRCAMSKNRKISWVQAKDEKISENRGESAR